MLILLKVTIDNVGVPFLRHSVDIVQSLSAQQQKHTCDYDVYVGWYWWTHQLRWVKEHRQRTCFVKRVRRQQFHDARRHSSSSNRCSSLQQ